MVSKICWCDKLSKISGYLCFDCEKTFKKKPKVNIIENSILVANTKALSENNLQEFSKTFWKAEAIREKYDPCHAMRRAEIEARKQEILGFADNMNFDEICFALYGESRGRDVPHAK